MKAKILLLSAFTIGSLANVHAQDMEVTGQMKVKQMTVDNAAQELVVQKNDGTLAKRTVASLVSGTNEVDSVGSFWRDIAVMQLLSNSGVTKLSAELLDRLKKHGYTANELKLKDFEIPFDFPGLDTVEKLDSVQDGDGNWYHPIATQRINSSLSAGVYLIEPLITTKYIDGTPIPFASANSAWQTAGTNGTAAYCWPNGSTANKAYGALYNWYAISEKQMCPNGYYIPSPYEIYTDLGTAGGKEYGNEYWDHINISSNSSGFSARGAGTRYPDGTFGEFRKLMYTTSNTGVYQLTVTYPNLAIHGTYQGQTLPSVSFGRAILDQNYITGTYTNSNDHSLNRPKALGYTVRCKKLP